MKLAPWTSGSFFCVVALGCSPATSHKIAAEPVKFAGIRYPPPSGLPASEPQAAPEYVEDPLPFPHRSTASLEPDASPAQLKNAAVRDEATEQLLRSYFGLVEIIYRVTAIRHPAMAPGADDYDPLPLMRLHGQLSSELARMERHAAALVLVWEAIALQLHVELAEDLNESSLAGRLRVLVRATACVRDDVRERRSHAQVYEKALNGQADEQAMREALDPQKRFAADMQMLGRTVECAKMVGRGLGFGS